MQSRWALIKRPWLHLFHLSNLCSCSFFELQPSAQCSYSAFGAPLMLAIGMRDGIHRPAESGAQKSVHHHDKLIHARADKSRAGCHFMTGSLSSHAPARLHLATRALPLVLSLCDSFVAELELSQLFTNLWVTQTHQKVTPPLHATLADMSQKLLKLFYCYC